MSCGASTATSRWAMVTPTFSKTDLTASRSSDRGLEAASHSGGTAWGRIMAMRLGALSPSSLTMVPKSWMAASCALHCLLQIPSNTGFTIIFKQFTLTCDTTFWAAANPAVYTSFFSSAQL